MKIWLDRETQQKLLFKPRISILHDSNQEFSPLNNNQFYSLSTLSKEKVDSRKGLSIGRSENPIHTI